MFVILPLEQSEGVRILALAFLRNTEILRFAQR